MNSSYNNISFVFYSRIKLLLKLRYPFTKNAICKISKNVIYGYETQLWHYADKIKYSFIKNLRHKYHKNTLLFLYLFSHLIYFFNWKWRNGRKSSVSTTLWLIWRKHESNLFSYPSLKLYTFIIKHFVSDTWL